MIARVLALLLVTLAPAACGATVTGGSGEVLFEAPPDEPDAGVDAGEAPAD